MWKESCENSALRKNKPVRKEEDPYGFFCAYTTMEMKFLPTIDNWTDFLLFLGILILDVLLFKS